MFNRSQANIAREQRCREICQILFERIAVQVGNARQTQYSVTVTP